MNRKIITKTPFGSVAVIWTGPKRTPKVVRILLSRQGESTGARAASLYPDSRALSCKKIDEAATSIRRLLDGEKAEFSLDMADLSQCSEFQQRVLRAEHEIPRGRVSTYNLIAQYLGIKGGARAVGSALATDPIPLIVPCHRAIRSDRHPGGYQGGLAMKRALLEKEGILFDEAGRVSRGQFTNKRYDFMKTTISIDTKHPANAGVLRFLRQSAKESLSVARGEVSCSPDSLKDPYYTLGTHPELVEILWDTITTRLPVSCRWVVYGAPVLVRPDTGIIFGWAGGTMTYALRLAVSDVDAYMQAARTKAAKWADEFELTGEKREKYIAIHSSHVWEYSDGSALHIRTFGRTWVLGRSLDNEQQLCKNAYEFAV